MLLLQIIYFLLPGYFANMFAVISAKLPWNTPIISDKHTFRGKPILGKNKTWRGLIIGIIAGYLIFLLQFHLYQNAIFSEIAYFDYNNYWLGLLLSFGAVFGDLFESFVKRQIGIPPGKKFIPWDQIDHVVFSLLFASLVITIPWSFAIYAIIITFILHIITNFIGYHLKLRKTLW